MLTAMGFGERHATAALAACDGSVERAADWLMSRIDDLDAAVEAALGEGLAGKGFWLLACWPAPAGVPAWDMQTLYRLCAFHVHRGFFEI